MNCEYCGRYVKDETCKGCGAPNPYLRGDVIHLREGIEPEYYANLSRCYGTFSTCGPVSSRFSTMSTSYFSSEFQIRTNYFK